MSSLFQKKNAAKAMDEIKACVGADHVVLDDEGIERRSRVIIPCAKNPSAFVYPGSVEELQQIVHIANAHHIALWPCSKGKNWGYGSATPYQEGSVVLVLERMNRILSCNTTLGFVVVEPGVTYRQLYRYLQEHRTGLWLDCTDGPAEGSVMGNALERGVGETPYGDHFEKICGLEVILPSGDLVRTGGGPFENYKSWNTHKWGVGPILDGLFSQSNYGIVTKMGLWLMPEPECFRSCLFELKREDDFPSMIEAVRDLQFSGALISKLHIINDCVTLAVVAEHPRDLSGGKSCMTDELRHKWQKEYNITSWAFAGGVYGTHAQVRISMSMIKRKLAPYGRLLFLDNRKVAMSQKIAKTLGRANASPRLKPLSTFFCKYIIRKPLPLIEMLPHMHAIEKGVPSDYFVKHAYFKSRRPKPADDDIDPARDNCGLIWIGPMVPLDKQHVMEVLDMCRPLYRKYEFDFTTALMVASPRSVIALMSVFYDREDPDETQRALDLYYEMGELTQQAGYQQYRTSVAYMDRVLKPAPEFKALADKIKHCLDPNNIMAPGKYGIH